MIKKLLKHFGYIKLKDVERVVRLREARQFTTEKEREKAVITRNLLGHAGLYIHWEEKQAYGNVRQITGTIEILKPFNQTTSYAKD